jgi:hypothetical protein
MKQSEILYRQAVSFAEQGDMAKAKRHILPIDYKLFYEKAFLLEKEAALLMSSDEKHPLSRGEMLKNATALAYKAGKYEDAQKVAALCRVEALDGYTMMKLEELEGLILAALAVPAHNSSLTVRGLFTSANADDREIKIRDMENQQVYSFIVPANMFKKVVKSYWQDVVSVVGHVNMQGVFTLEKIGRPAA